MDGRIAGRHSTKTTRMLLLASLPVAALPLVCGTPVRANVLVSVPNGTSDLTSLGAGSGTDLAFSSGTAYSPAAFTINSALTVGTLDDLDSTAPSLSISNTSATLDTLTVAGGSNSVAPSANDLLYVTSGGTLSISGGTGSTPLLNIAFGAAVGNLDIAGTASTSSALSGSGLITMTGGGTLTLSPLVASASASNSGLTGGFTIANGTVNLGGATNAPNWGLGKANGSVTLGNSASNATLNFTATASGVAQNFTIGGAGTDEITNSAGSATFGNAAIFAAANTITLNANLTVSNLVSSVAGTGNILGFRGNILGSAYSVTVPSTNVGTVDLRGANTFTGLTINGGAVSFNASGVNTLVSGPLGIGTVSLGNANLVAGGAFNLYNPLTSTNAGATLSMDSASASAPTFFGQINLTNDPITLTSIASTQTGVDRIRFGDGGIIGGNNIIINDPLNAAMTGVGSDAIRLDGNGTATAWTGNLIVAAGLASIGGSSNANAVSAIGSSNIVEIASGALFDYSSTTGGNSTNFSPTIAGLSNYSGGGGTVYDISTNNQTLHLAGSGTYAFSGTIADSTSAGKTTALAVNLQAGGTQTLSGASTYSGGTTITGGTLSVIHLSSGSETGTGPVALSGGTLEGTGSSSGLLTVTNASLIAPGVNTSGPGNDFGDAETLSLGTTGGMTLTNANLDFDLGTSATAPGTSDLITTGGTLTLGTVNFTFNPLGASLDTSNPYTLISGANSVVVDPMPTGTVIGGVYTPVFSLNGDDLQVTFVVPEPTTLGMLGASSLALLMRRRRKA
ncbi:MAG: PEP-CTERM sorting domain-containing protein [Tepidisphaeraceae bacterium]|jgi:autotransporter-associated beta strand protein